MSDFENGAVSRAEAVRLADEALLADLGYKQEFKRAFTPLEVRGDVVLVEALCIDTMSLLFRSSVLRSQLLDCCHQ